MPTTTSYSKTLKTLVGWSVRVLQHHRHVTSVTSSVHLACTRYVYCISHAIFYDQLFNYRPLSSISATQYDLIVVGGGIVGLATAIEIALRNTHMNIALLEKENQIGRQRL